MNIKYWKRFGQASLILASGCTGLMLFGWLAVKWPNQTVVALALCGALWVIHTYAKETSRRD